jgi:hypothetical protein
VQQRSRQPVLVGDARSWRIRTTAPLTWSRMAASACPRADDMSRLWEDELPLPAEEGTMARATVKNEQKILAGHRTIIANQTKIIRNQNALRPILDNQDQIIRNQEAILKNQKKILADHARHFRELARKK